MAYSVEIFKTSGYQKIFKEVINKIADLITKLKDN